MSFICALVQVVVPDSCTTPFDKFVSGGKMDKDGKNYLKENGCDERI